MEELGYTPNYAIHQHPEVYKNIAVCNFFGPHYYGVSTDEASRPGNIKGAIKNKGVIDCGDNEELFLALAALRNDTDINQWFIYNSMDCIIEKLRTIDWFICTENSIEDLHFMTVCICFVIKQQ